MLSQFTTPDHTVLCDEPGCVQTWLQQGLIEENKKQLQANHISFLFHCYLSKHIHMSYLKLSLVALNFHFIKLLFLNGKFKSFQIKKTVFPKCFLGNWKQNPRSDSKLVKHFAAD